MKLPLYNGGKHQRSTNIIKHLLTRYSGNSKFIDPSIPTIDLGFSSSNSWYLGINKLTKEKHTSFVTYGYSFIVHKKTEDFLLELKMLKW